MEKVLVGTLFSDVKDYALKDWFKNVCSFIYPQFDFCGIDNSSNETYSQQMRDFFVANKEGSNIGKLEVIHTPKKNPNSEIFMADSANALRDYFIKGGYDYLLYLECDIFPPRDILERLLSYKKQVISALYFSGDKKYSYPMLIDAHYFFDEMVSVINPYLLGFYRAGEFGRSQKIISAGLGCVLLYKEILHRISFRGDPTLQVHPDTLFSEDLWRNNIGYELAPIICRHENQLWDIQKTMLEA